MKQKMYSVEVSDGCSFFVIAYSREHAIVEIVNLERKENLESYPSDFSLKSVKRLYKEDMEDIIISLNYKTDELKETDLYSIFKEIRFNYHEEWYGVVGDNFVEYNN